MNAKRLTYEVVNVIDEGFPILRLTSGRETGRFVVASTTEQYGMDSAAKWGIRFADFNEAYEALMRGTAFGEDGAR